MKRSGIIQQLKSTQAANV